MTGQRPERTPNIQNPMASIGCSCLLLMPPRAHSISAGRPAAPDTAPFPVLHGLLESAKGIAIRCNRTRLHLNWYFLRVTVPTSVVRHLAQSSKSIRERRAVLPGVRHRRNPSCVPVVRDWTAPAQMQRSRLTACAFPLLAERFPVPFQCSPNWFPILRRRFHDYFFGFLLNKPCRQRAQLFGVATKHPPSNWYSLSISTSDTTTARIFL